MGRSVSMTITGDRLADYIMGRMPPAERARLGEMLAANPALRGALRRLRRTARTLRERCVEPVDAVPDAWLGLIETIAGAAPRPPLSPADLDRERRLTWL